MSSDPAGGEARCRSCGEAIEEDALVCPECGAGQRPDRDVEAPSGKRPLLAAAASLVVPGLGQVYNGEYLKGLVGFGLTIGAAMTGVGLVVAVPAWLWLIYNAYRVAKAGGSSSRNLTNHREVIRTVLEWRAEDASDPDAATALRNRFERQRLSRLDADDLEAILDAIDAYEDEEDLRTGPTRDFVVELLVEKRE